MKEYLTYLSDTDNLRRSTFFLGLKFIFSSKKYSEYEIDYIIDLLIKGLLDDDLKSKQNAFSSLINCVHMYSKVIKTKKGCFDNLWNIFKKDNVIDKSLIEIVDIGGGMKIKNDKGLVIRKSIYSSIKILLESIPEKFSMSETLQVLLVGLDDNEDIQAIAHSCFLKIAYIAPEAFISIIDVLTDNLNAKLHNLLNPPTEKGAEAKIDKKKVNDLQNTVKRLFDEIKKVPEVEENPKFTDLFYAVKNDINDKK